MRKHIAQQILLASFIMVCNSLSAANHHDEVFKYIHAKDTIKARNELLVWEKEEPKSADLYATWFNYYYWVGEKEFIGTTTDLPEGIDDYMTLTDSTGATSGYVYSITTYCKDSIDTAFRMIDKGISYNPKRLDLHFGRIHVMLQLANEQKVSSCGDSTTTPWPEKPTASDVTDYLCKLTDTKDHNNWMWTNDQKIDDSEDVFYESMQSYFADLISLGDMDAAERLVDKLLTKKQTMKFRNDKGYLMAMKKEYDKAIDCFIGIHKDYPDDETVIANIASCYEKKGDTKKAIKYYEMLAKSGDEERKAMAEESIKELKKKKK